MHQPLPSSSVPRTEVEGMSENTVPLKESYPVGQLSPRDDEWLQEPPPTAESSTIEGPAIVENATS